MRFRRKYSDEGVDVQLTSFMDIAFLLLIFFIVTASLRKPHKELPINLPDAGAAVTAKAPKEELIISIDAAGVLYLDNAAGITEEEFKKRLQDVSQKSPQTRIRIDADRQARVYHIAKVMDLCMLYNLNNVGVRTRTN